MAFRLGANTSNNIRKKSNDALVGALDVGTTNTSAQMLIYTGTQPATPDTAPSTTLLVTIPFANPSFAASDATGTAGLAGGTAISATVTASGTAGWFRVQDRNGNDMFDGSCGTSGADLNFNNVTFVSGGTATISSMSIQTPM